MKKLIITVMLMAFCVAGFCQNNVYNSKETKARELVDKGREYLAAEDYENAFLCHKQAAGLGYAAAQNSLGECYRMGLGVDQDYSEAVKWYRKAAEQGNADAQNNLGLCYDNGFGVIQSETEAVKWYRKAANQGHVIAMCNLGTCYAQGNGVPQSEVEAVKWYEKAAEQGSTFAQALLSFKGLSQDEIDEIQIEEEVVVEAVHEEAIMPVYPVAELKMPPVELGPITVREDPPSLEDKVFDVVEVMPSFPGGTSALMQYISANLRYPVIAQENGIQGRVGVGFIVERDGSITDVKVIRAVDPTLDKEAVRIVSTMPKWIPGKQNGQTVRVRYNVPVTFKLQ